MTLVQETVKKLTTAIAEVTERLVEHLGPKNVDHLLVRRDPNYFSGEPEVVRYVVFREGTWRPVVLHASSSRGGLRVTVRVGPPVTRTEREDPARGYSAEESFQKLLIEEMSR